MAAVLLAAVVADRHALERQARRHRDAMIPLLPVERRVRVAEAAEALHRKRVVRALRLLQADHIRPHRLDESRDQVDAQADGIDVPGGDREGHTRLTYCATAARASDANKYPLSSRPSEARAGTHIIPTLS